MRDAPTPAPTPSSEVVRPLAALSRNVFHLVMGQAGTTAMSVFLSAALARTLGAVDFGLLYLVTTMTIFAYAVVEWGQHLYVPREVARAPARAGELLGSAIAFRAASAAAVAGPAVLLAWSLGYPARTLGLYAILLGAYFPVSIVQTLSLVLRGRERMELDALLSIFAKALALGATVVALALGGRVLSVIVAQGLAATLAVGAAFSLVRVMRLLPSPRIATTAMRELLVGGAPIVALNAAILAQPYLDAIVLSMLAPPVVMGWHAAAKTFMAAFVTPAAILASAAYPRLSRAAPDRAAFGHELKTAIRPLVWVAAGATSATYLLADVAIAAVYGRAGYAPAVTALEWFAPALLLFFVDILLGHACVAIGKTRAFALAKAGAVVISTALDVALVPWFQARAGNGVLGVVVSLILSELVMITAAMVLLPRGTLRSIASDIGRAVVAAAGGPVLLMALPPTGVMVRGAIGAIAFMALSAAVGLVTLEDIRVLRESFRRRSAGAQTG